MSTGKNDAFNDYEINDNSESIMDDDEWAKLLGSVTDEAELDEVIESMLNETDMLIEIGESEEYAHVLRKLDEAAAFEQFYFSCFREANELAMTKPSYTFACDQWQSDAYFINHWLEHNNKVDAFIVKEIAPKLHAYIRKHGIPVFFPGPAGTRGVTFDPDSSIPFQANKIGIYFEYCGCYHPTMPNGNFKHFFDKDNDCVVLNAQLIMPTYTPNWRDDYDEEFSRLCAEADALEKQIQNIEDKLKAHQVNQLTDIFDSDFLYSFSKTARKERQKMQTLLPGLKKQWEDILNSDAYDAARRRNQEAYEADCRLAAEWQRKWYEECRKKTPERYY